MFALVRALLVVFSLFFVVNDSKAGFTCDASTMTYNNCDRGFYLSDCGTTFDGHQITTPKSGNSCIACTGCYTCPGGATCPYTVGTATSTVTCAAGYYGAGGTVAQGSISKNRGQCTAPRTSLALNVKVGDKVFYGAMSTALTSKLKVKDIDNKTYSVVNDYQ